MAKPSLFSGGYGAITQKRDSAILRGYESEVVSWVRVHYKELGYDQILKEEKYKFPDFVFLRNGQEVRVEVEVYSGSFIQHKHNPQKVDEVLCVIKDKDLPLKIIEIKTLKLWHQLQGEELVDFFKQMPDCTLICQKYTPSLFY